MLNTILEYNLMLYNITYVLKYYLNYKKDGNQPAHEL